MAFKKNIVAIIQARLGSKRFPNKVLTKIEGKPLIQYVFNAVKKVKIINKIILATTNESIDNKLVQWANNKKGLFVYRGHSTNVLERFYNAARFFKADIIVRITADDPLKDPKIITMAIREMIQNPSLDYVSNTITPNYPEGLDIEVFSFSALRSAYKLSKKESEKEHVTPFIWKNPKIFNIKSFFCQEDLSHLRWTVDYPSDLKKIKQLFRISRQNKNKQLYKIAIEKPHHKIFKQKTKFERNKGYLVSLKND